MLQEKICNNDFQRNTVLHLYISLTILWKWRNNRRSERNLCICVRKPEKTFRTSTGFEPVTSRLPVRCSTNWAMKPLTLGAGQLWVHMFPWKKWVLMIYEINHIWTAEMKWKWRNDRRSERNLCNFVKKPDIVSICFNIVPTLLLLKIVVANRFLYLNITLNRFTEVVICKSAFRLIYHPIHFTFCFT